MEKAPRWPEGVLVGQAEDVVGMTGVTGLLFPQGATAGCFVGGFATGSRELDALKPEHPVPFVHGAMIAGGSAYGLEAARGVMDYLEEQGVGLPVGGVLVPIVPAAILFDLSFGDAKARPRREMGYQAACRAKADPPDQGSVGAGTGATVGKAFGKERAMKGGLGVSFGSLPEGGSLGAIACVNAFGDIVDPKDGKTLAGLREAPDSLNLLNTETVLEEAIKKRPWDPSSTTLGLVITDVPLSKVQAKRVAKQAFGAIHMTHRPAISTFDGDIVFVFSTSLAPPSIPADALAVYAKDHLIKAIKNAVIMADGFGILPSYSQIIGV